MNEEWLIDTIIELLVISMIVTLLWLTYPICEGGYSTVNVDEFQPKLNEVCKDLGFGLVN